MAALLRHFEALQIDWAPRYLGEDRSHRDILSYMPGHVPQRWGHFSDAQVADAGRLLRAFHDATKTSDLRGTASVVCHNDFGPNNAVFVDERPVALIDFDMATPGEVLDDLGYTAWSWCISSKEHRPPIHVQARQVRLFVDAYGGLCASSRVAVIDAVLGRQERNARFWSEVLNNPAATCATSPDKMPEIIEWSRTEQAFVRANRRQFEEALA
ncbi:MAG TPA: phosphotransferase [Polyangiaceae bacterium]